MESDKVIDRKSFIEFMETLLKDFDKNADNWENRTLRDFLEALSAYANDVQGYYNNCNISIDANTPSWRVFADIMQGATIYE